MAQRALAGKARRAIEWRLVIGIIFQPDHLRQRAERRRVQRAGRAKDGHLWYAQGGGHMHQPRVIADHGPRLRNQRYGLFQTGAPG